jgi:hypothetical protein
MVMSDAQLDREARFLMGMDFFRAMLTKGIIIEEQYRDLGKKLAEKYNPPAGILSLTN